MTTYTPGPWKLSDPVKEQPVLAYRILGANFPQDGLDSIVADLVWQTENDNELFQRNARLIAASPRLLEALKDVTERFAIALKLLGSSPDVVDMNVAKARQAIAQAQEGKP